MEGKGVAMCRKPLDVEEGGQARLPSMVRVSGESSQKGSIEDH